MVIVNIIAAILAAWRITQAINREKIGKPIRVKLAGEQEESPEVIHYSDTFLSQLITCFNCLSFWVSIFCVTLAYVFPLFLYPFAVSTLVILLDEAYQHG